MLLIKIGGIQNAIPAVIAMLMVLIYNLADTFFIGQTHDAYQVAAVSLATPVFLIFMSVGSIFGIGGTSVIARALGEGKEEYSKKVCSFCMWSCVGIGIVLTILMLVFMDKILVLIGASPETPHWFGFPSVKSSVLYDFEKDGFRAHTYEIVS